MLSKTKGGSTSQPRLPSLRVGKRGLVFLDLNDCLITESGAVTTVTPAELKEAIHTAGRRGWWVGLCSDSPFGPLQRWGERHGIRPGATIAENGAVVENRPMVRFDSEPVCDAIRRWAAEGGVPMLEPPAFAREFGGYNPTGAGIAFGACRQCSVSLFCYRADKTPDDDITARIGTHLRALYGNAVDCDPMSGFVAVHTTSEFRTMKGATLRRVGARLAKTNRRLVMIGNSVSDLIGDPALGESWMVGNATPDAKARADRALTLAHTQGVIEGLKLLSQS